MPACKHHRGGGGHGFTLVPQQEGPVAFTTLAPTITCQAGGRMVDAAILATTAGFGFAGPDSAMGAGGVPMASFVAVGGGASRRRVRRSALKRKVARTHKRTYMRRHMRGSR